MPEQDLGFIHQFVPARSSTQYTLLLLHGTGGDERDLLPLGAELGNGAALLSPRGKVLENGMPRFFRRLSMGVFDLEDLKFRTHELAAFVKRAAQLYGFDPSKILALGYSNGANIAASMLLLSPGTLSGAILLRPMPGIVPDPLPALTGLPVWIGGGQRDTVIPPASTAQLGQILQKAGAAVEMHWAAAGHELTQGELNAAQSWLEARQVAE